MQINPYVIFNGQCREAFSTYAQCLGGDVTFSTYGEMPGGVQQPGQSPDHIMHARLEAHGAVLLGSDGPGGDGPKDAVWVSVTLHDTGEAERIFAALAEGGHVVMPLAETFWAPRFGMLKDRFGLSWMINCERAA
ncbi:VOC family protein [Luteitalea sp.]|jgi:PhnB protein|uniref:VOC family protein n=1 Tax=Luteitalea sp. TaxID=2004800 RepID=UPI0037C626F8